MKASLMEVRPNASHMEVFRGATDPDSGTCGVFLRRWISPSSDIVYLVFITILSFLRGWINHGILKGR